MYPDPFKAMPKQLTENEKQLLVERLTELDGLTRRFPDIPANGVFDHRWLERIENWARAATVAIFNTFHVLAEIPYRTRQMDTAIEHVRHAFHAVFELVFLSKRDPGTEEIQRAKSAVETMVVSCNRLV